jgi:glycosyltransferase 2 family protein
VKDWGKIWRTGWRLALCVLLLGWIFHAIFMQEGRHYLEAAGYSWEELSKRDQYGIAWRQGPPELWRTLKLVNPGAFLVSLVFMGLTLLIGMLRWRLALQEQGLHLSFGRTAEISLVAHFFNSFLLGSTGGDLLKAYYAARETHHRKAEAVTTVVADRLIGFFAMLLFAGLMMIPNWSLLLSHGPLGALAWVILLMLSGATVLGVISFWGGISRMGFQSRIWLRKLPKGDLVERALDACRHLGRQKSYLLRALALSMLLNVAVVFQVLFLAWGLGLDISVRALFVIVPVVVCISALPITPSGLGVRENLYVLLLAAPLIQVEPTRALSLSLLAYAGFLLWSILGGLVYVTRKDREHLDELQVDAGAAEAFEKLPNENSAS